MTIMSLPRDRRKWDGEVKVGQILMPLWRYWPRRRRFCLLALMPIILDLMVGSPGHASESVVVWGNNSYGQTNVPTGLSNIVALAGGDYHLLALSAEGAVTAWGANGSGQTNVSVGLTNIGSIAAGSTHSLALRTDGKVFLWGRMLTGVTNVPAEATNVVALALGPGAWHALALRADGRLLDWGLPTYGLEKIPHLATNIVAVAVGAFHSIALRADGRVVAWGDNSRGQTNVPVNATNLVAISAGWHHNVGLRADGTVLAWGLAAPPAAASNGVIEVASGGNHALVLKRDGSVTTWGNNDVVPIIARKGVAIAGSSYNSLAVVEGREPIFKTPAIDRTVVLGTTAYFRMFAVGAYPMGYQWRCNGTNLPGATNSILGVPAAQLWQAGEHYTVVASNVFGASTSAPIALNVAALEAVVQPQEATVLPGTTVTFNASMIGMGPFIYQWRTNGASLDGATNASLVLTNVQLIDAAAISLLVSNSHGGVTSPSATLGVVPLFITNQTPSQTVIAGTNVTLQVAAGGQPPFSYQWQFGGTNLLAATGPALLVTNIQLSQAGTYSVVVSNDYGAVTNSGSVLRVVTLLFTSQPQSQTVAAGTDVTFSAAVVGLGSYQYHWQLDGTNLNGATNSTLVLTNVQVSDAGTYVLVGSNSNGAVNSSGAKLKVEPLLITSQPQSTTVVPGANATFSVTASGQQPFSYQWQLNGSELASATNKSLSLTNIQMGQSGAFSVVITNAYGAVTSSVAALKVVPLTITVPPQDRAVLAGATTSFSVTASGKVPFSYQWQFNDTLLSGATKATLQLTNIQMNQAGYYSVVVSNSYGAITSAWAELSVTPLTITTHPQNRTVIAGSTGTFSVIAGGQKPLSYQWQLNGQNLAGATNTTLILTNVQPNAAGAYSVVVINAFASQTSNPGQLTVIPMQIVSAPFASLSIFRGGTLTMAVAAEASQPVAYQWSFNGADLDGATNNSLSLTNVQFPNSGTYAVSLSNVFGTASSTSQLSVVSIAAWGDDYTGKTSVPPDLTNVFALATGSLHNLAVRSDGTIAGWGGWMTRPSGISNLVAVAGGEYHSVALREDGTVMAWGYNDLGQTNFPADLTNAVAIAARGNYSLALRSDGTVDSWGENAGGQTDIPAGLSNVVSLAAGYYHVLALRRDGTAVAWGDNAAGQTNLPPDLTNLVAVAAGFRHSLALRADGTISAWGENTYGQADIPPGLSNVVAIGAGHYFSLAIRADGTVVGWGYSVHGETSPPAGLNNVIAVAGGEYHVVALVGDAPPLRRSMAGNPARSASGFSLQLPTQCGRVYALEYKNSLTDANWVALPLVAGSGRILTLTDSTAQTSSRFYRVRAW